MKLLFLFLLVCGVALSSCTTLEEGGGKIGTEYSEEPAYRTSQAQEAHNRIQRGVY